MLLPYFIKVSSFSNGKGLGQRKPSGLDRTSEVDNKVAGFTISFGQYCERKKWNRLMSKATLL